VPDGGHETTVGFIETTKFGLIAIYRAATRVDGEIQELIYGRLLYRGICFWVSVKPEGEEPPYDQLHALIKASVAAAESGLLNERVMKAYRN
jgi:hypothetical protein